MSEPRKRFKTLAEARAGRGLECPHCGCRHFETVRTARIPGAVRRVRVCRHCGKRKITFET